jgi:hypothetical protein
MGRGVSVAGGSGVSVGGSSVGVVAGVSLGGSGVVLGMAVSVGSTITGVSVGGSAGCRVAVAGGAVAADGAGVRLPPLTPGVVSQPEITNAAMASNPTASKTRAKGEDFVSTR